MTRATECENSKTGSSGQVYQGPSFFGGKASALRMADFRLAKFDLISNIKENELSVTITHGQSEATGNEACCPTWSKNHQVKVQDVRSAACSQSTVVYYTLNEQTILATEGKAR